MRSIFFFTYVAGYKVRNRIMFQDLSSTNLNRPAKSVCIIDAKCKQNPVILFVVYNIVFDENGRHPTKINPTALFFQRKNVSLWYYFGKTQ